MLQEGEPSHELLPELDSDLEELERMVARVLDAARLDLELDRGVGAVLGPRETLVASELVERVAARFRLAHPARALDVHAEPELARVSVSVDTPALLRACDNLLDNAVRHGPRDRPLHVEARCVAAQLELSVRDEGPGIPESLHELVFTPFFRADPSRSRETGGLGLGLTLVARTVEVHGGTIRLDSREGEGAQFTITLPLVRT
jgi:two-component system sensor histidine kinase SenX3